MRYLKSLTIAIFLLRGLYFTEAHHPAQNPSCKAIPGSPDWPSGSSWSALNSSLSGRLLQLAPPGAVCHPDQPTYNAAICLTVQDGSQRHGIQRILSAALLTTGTMTLVYLSRMIPAAERDTRFMWLMPPAQRT